MPWGQYMQAGAEAGQRERLHKADLAALMQRFREQQALSERQFGFSKDVYERSQQEAARARAEAEFSQQFNMLPTEATLAQPSFKWWPDIENAGFDRPKLLTGKEGQPTGVGTERVDKYREMGGPAQESLVKSFVAAGKAGTPQQGEAVIESMLRSRREGRYGAMGADAAKAVADPEWYKARTGRMAVGQDKKDSYVEQFKILESARQQYNEQRGKRLELEIDTGDIDLTLEDIERKMDSLVQQAPDLAYMRYSVAKQQPASSQKLPTGSFARGSPQAQQLAPPPKPSLWQRIPQAIGEAIMPYPPKFLSVPGEPEPYKSQDEARPAGMKLPAPPQQPLGSPGTGMGPQSALPQGMGGQQFAQAIPPPFFGGEEPLDTRGLPNLGTGPEIRPRSIQDEYNKAKIQRGHGNTPFAPGANEITAGAPDVSAMIAMIDEAMPFLSDEEVAALVRQNMQIA